MTSPSSSRNRRFAFSGHGVGPVLTPAMLVPYTKGGNNVTFLKNIWQDEEGLTTVEYALLLALLVVAAIGVWTAFGAKVEESVSKSTNALTNTLGS